MSLIKCDECGIQYSDKAISCPRCDAPLPKKRSRAGVLFAILIVSVWFTMQMAPSKKSDQVVKSAETQQPKQTETTKPLQTTTEVSQINHKWQIAIDVNEISGKRTHLTSSPSVKPIRKMTFPYENITAKLVVSCHKREESAYIEFSDAPNFANKNIRSGYVILRTNIKWDSKVEDVEFTQHAGRKKIYFYRDEVDGVIKKLTESKKVMIKFQWYRQEPTFFDFNLDGASESIKQIQLQCWRET